MREIEPEYSRHLDDMEAIDRSLQEDVSASFAAYQADGSQTNRRAYVRAVFSSIEGIAFILRQEALNPYYSGPPDHLETAEIALLMEEDYQIDSRGRAKTKQYVGPTLPLIKFSIGSFIKAYELDRQADYGGQGWEDLQAAAAIRNRITHPRSGNALEITDSEMEQIVAAYDWFNNTVNPLFGAATHAVNEWWQAQER
jgi:hypothetical protein